MHSISKVLLCFLVSAVAGYVVYVYGFLPLGALLQPEMKANFQAHSTAIYIHAFASLFALTLGPLQFSSRLRQRQRHIHRWLGRAYLAVGVLVGGLSGLYLSLFAYGGVMSKLGFAVLALLWLYTGLRALLAIRAADIAQHRKWMIRNFSLTFAAVTLRLYLPAAFVPGVEFAQAYQLIAWLCWVPNLLIAEWRYNGGFRRNGQDAEVVEPGIGT